MALRVPAGCEYFSAKKSLPEIEANVRRLAYQFGETYSSYLVTEDGWESFWSPDRAGVVRFVRWCGYYALSVGGLLAPPEEQAKLLKCFKEFLELNNISVMFMNVGRDQLAPFRAQGFEITKTGEEPFVPLESATWQGKDFEWIRRQENYCKKQGLELVEIIPDPADPVYVHEIAPQLMEISNAHVAGTVHGRELRYFVGRFLPFEMADRRIFCARNGNRIEAFIVCNPCLEGTMWAIEMYRRREDATRGVIPFAMLQTMRQLQSEGVAYCSLSAIPMLRCDHSRKGDSLIVRGTCMIWWRYCNFLYDMQGIYHFKSRFRPEYREIYIVAYKKASILSLIAMGRVWGIIKVSPFRMISKLYQQVSKSRTRKNLAPPEVRPERVMRKLARPNTQSSLANTRDRSVAPAARIEADRQPIAAIAEQAHAP